MPATAKVAHLRRSSAVSLALDSAEDGQDIVLGDGNAELPGADDPRLRSLTEAFRDKYAPRLGTTTFEEWRSTFSTPILVTAERIVAWSRTPSGVAYRVVPAP